MGVGDTRVKTALEMVQCYATNATAAAIGTNATIAVGTNATAAVGTNATGAAVATNAIVTGVASKAAATDGASNANAAVVVLTCYKYCN